MYKFVFVDCKNIDYIIGLIYNKTKERGDKMSEVYLTKIERKTIFTRALIYVLIMFIVADLTVTGPFWFNFIPWLFILGLLGSLKGIDKVLIGIIGTFTVFISSTIIEAGVTLNVGLNTLVAMLSLICGIATGKCIYQFVLEHRLVKYLRPRRKTTLIFAMIAFAAISIFSGALLHGDVVSYLTSRNKLDKYIQKTYAGKEYTVKKSEYSREVIGGYLYVVNIDGQDVWFSPVTKTEFKDANIDARLSRLNEELNSAFTPKVNKIFSSKEDKYLQINSTDVSAMYEYDSLSIIPDNIVIYITCDTQEGNETKLYEELATLIPELTADGIIDNTKLSKIVLCINKVDFEILKKNFNLIDKKYIAGGFEIENLDE